MTFQECMTYDIVPIGGSHYKLQVIKYEKKNTIMYNAAHGWFRDTMQISHFRKKIGFR
jgi:hypothetical protein